MKATKRYCDCELCEAPARVYCDADQASLCWDCDDGVHGANFLVARHCRTLLCQTCNSLSEWRASGSKLGRMVSVCEHCNLGAETGAKEEDFDEIDMRDNDDFGDIEEEDDDLAEEEVVSHDEDRDNQVVPSVATFSSSRESVPELTISLKRKRGDASDLSSQDSSYSSPPPQYDLRQNISSKYGCASTTTEDHGFGDEVGENERKHKSAESFRALKKDTNTASDCSIVPQPVTAAFRRISSAREGQGGTG